MGLFLFLALISMSFGVARKITRTARRNERLVWARDLAAMLQVSMVGYLTGGAFLGLGYFDLPYHIIALLILTHTVITREGVEDDGTNAQSGARGSEVQGRIVAGNP